VHGVGVALQILLWVALAAWLLSAAALLNQRSVAAEMFDGFSLEAVRDLEDADDAVGATGGLTVLVGIAVFVLVVVWLYRASKNLDALGRSGRSLGPGWAIGGWFVPVANVVLPAVVLHDAWRGSDPTVAAGDTHWKQARSSPLLFAWWLLLVAGWVLSAAGNAFTDTSGEYETYADFRAGNALSIAASLTLGAAAVLGALFVRALTARQDLWGRHLGFQAPLGAPPAWNPPPAGPSTPPRAAPPAPPPPPSAPPQAPPAVPPGGWRPPDPPGGG
jgi:hypothetical protein